MGLELPMGTSLAATNLRGDLQSRIITALDYALRATGEHVARLTETRAGDIFFGANPMIK